MYKFVIDGTPIAIKRFQPGARGDFDIQRQDRLRFTLMITNLLAERPKLAGPIYIRAQFFFQIPRNSPHQQEKLQSTPFLGKPKLNKLNEFIEECMHGIVYDNRYEIAQIIGTKHYDFIPRTEITIGLLVHEKENK